MITIIIKTNFKNIVPIEEYKEGNDRILILHEGADLVAITDSDPTSRDVKENLWINKNDYNW